jgi:pilus assembly protein CpaE
MLNVSTRETLRVLLIAERDERRDEVSRALTKGAGAHQLYWVAQPELAVNRTQEVLPQVVLIDDELSGKPVGAIVKQLMVHSPGVVILVLLRPGAMAEAQQAVLAGARGFVTKPLVAEEFWSTVQQVLGQYPLALATTRGGAAPTIGNVLVFCGPKGGTGRTTIATNTAIQLHRATQKSVVMIDADFSSPALDVILNLHEERDITDLLTRISHLDEDLIQRVLVRHGSGVQVLLAPPPTAEREPLTLPQVQQIVAHLKRIFDWVIIDLGLPLDESAFAFLDGADRIVMTVLPEMVGLRNSRLMLDQFYERGYAEDKVWLVLNRATIRGGISPRDIETRLRVRVRHTVPDDQPLVSYSINRGVPLVLSHERGAVARAIADLAQHLQKEGKAAPATLGNPVPTLAEGLQRWLGRVRPVNLQQPASAP